jgi:hypothetical protein
MIRFWYATRAAEVLSATARPVVLKPVITPNTKKAHTTSPPIRAFQPATTLSFLRLATATTFLTEGRSIQKLDITNRRPA